MLNYFFQLFLDLFERVEDGGDGFLFLASPFFHFSLRENRHKWLQMKSSHLPRRESQSSRGTHRKSSAADRCADLPPTSGLAIKSPLVAAGGAVQVAASCAIE